jgi:hypothetical protein
MEDEEGTTPKVTAVGANEAIGQLPSRLRIVGYKMKDVNTLETSQAQKLGELFSTTSSSTDSVAK